MGVRRGTLRFVGLALALLCLLVPAAAQATTFDVTDTNDSGDGSLRQAILDANAAEGADDIDATGVTGTINLQSALPSLTESVDIAGPGPDQLTVRRDAGGEYRIFDIAQAVETTISGLTIANGDVSGDGGGIFNFGALTIQDTVVSGNSADGDGGGIYNTANVDFEGTLAVQDSIVRENQAGDDGGGIFTFGPTHGPTLVHGSQVTENDAGGDGGGIWGAESIRVDLLDSAVDKNSAVGRGGGVFASPAIGWVAADTSTIADNEAGTGGGIYGVAVLDQTIVTGNSATAEPTPDSNRGSGGGVLSGLRLTLTDSLITDNHATLGGGGIFTVQATAEITSTVISDNSADFGGGIAATFITGLNLRDSTVSGNEAVRAGGGITNDKAMTITSSTISGNAVTGPDGKGGGIYNHALGRITNTTISENTATGSGGGVWAYPSTSGSTTLTSSTIARNAAPDGSNLFQSGYQTHLVSTILADPLGGPHNCGFDHEYQSDSMGFNLADDNSCRLGSPTDKTVADAGLWPLADNGGPTETMIPASASPAIDQGAGSGTDQRGLGRPYDDLGIPNAVGGNGADVGAVELQDGEFVPNPPGVDLGPPETSFTIRPKKRMRTESRRIELRFGFSGQDDVTPRGELSFDCQLDRKKKGPCSSPVERKFKLGRHTFRVWASDEAENTDPTPAKFRFKVKRAN